MMEMIGLTAGNNWYWGGRQVYRFDKELSSLLYSQTKEDINIDCETLNLLPYPHFYISLDDDIRQGIFVSYLDNVLYISDLGNDFTFSVAFNIPQNL